MNNKTDCSECCPAVVLIDTYVSTYAQTYACYMYLHIHIFLCTFVVLNFDLFCGWQTSFDCQRLCLCLSLSLFRFVHFSSLQNRSTLPQLPPPSLKSLWTPPLAWYSSSFQFSSLRTVCYAGNTTPLNSTRLTSQPDQLLTNRRQLTLLILIPSQWACRLNK